MPIEGQGSSPFDDRGFTMVVLLVVIAIMGVGMLTMLPTWRQQSIREKEEELIFRGNQYARAIALYARKNNNVLPANVDVLVDGKYLRRKWKDPITGTDFGLLPAGQPANAGRGGVPQGPGAPGGTRGGGPPTTMGGQQPGATGARGGGPGSPQVGTQIVGSFQGVYSTSSDTSIRVYQNQQRYIDWQFTVQTANLLMGQQGRGGQPGRGGLPADGRGGPAGPGGARGGNPAGVPGRGGAPGRGLQPGGRGPQQGGPGRGGPVPPGGPGGRGRGNF